MRKAKLKILSLLTVATVISSISLNTISALATDNNVTIQSEEKVASTLNLALGKTALASSVEPEGPSFTADKITDGDRTSKSSRWSSGHFNNGHQPWIYVDLGEETEFDKVKLFWEGANATIYRIEVSNDAENWTEIHRKENAPGGEELISFEEKQNGRYVRLFCEKNNPAVWTTVSLYEMEIYNGELPTSPQEVINNLVVPNINKGDTHLQMPKVPADMEIEFIGCDYQEIIASDLTINEPLIDTKVTVDFRVKQGSTSLETKGIEITVPGKYSGNIGANTKPDVIPSLREWVGKDGNFQITDGSRIVLDANYEDRLNKTAEVFKEDYKYILGKDIEIVTGEPKAGDFYFTLNCEDKSIGEEGYYLYIDDYVKVEAIDETGAFYSTRSILQVLKQTKNTIAKGIVRDFPRYENRGFMLDVGRKPITMDYLEETTKLMSWYKMNDFQVHLNDNEIWFYDDYENWQDGYAAFRLESEAFPEITSKDLSYTKKEFGEFIDKSELYGVNIVPEIDVPAHSLAFTKAFPELRQGDGRKADHLNVRNPETFKFVDTLFNEYIGGENPVFRDQDFHIGTDEYNGDNEGFRMFTNKYLDFVRDNGRTPRLWGSLSQIGGQPSVPGEGATMNIWNLGWADPVAMMKQGFDIINTDDSNLYIVPGASYYRDYLNYKSLYENWEPNTFRGNYSYKIPAGHPQLKGGMFAVWNDLIGARANGMSELDIFDRMMPAVQVLSEKMWSTDNEKSFNEFKEVADEVGIAPNTNPRYEVESVGETLLDYDFDNGSESEVLDNSGNNYNATGSNVEVTDGQDGKAISFKGESSFVDTPVENKGPNYTATFKVKKDANGDFSEQILSESKNGSLKACQKETGKVGFSREFYDFSFNYELPEDQWVELTFVGEMTKTSLYVNGQLVDTVSSTSDHGKVGTFVLPLDKLGSETQAFKGAIDDVKVKNIADKPLDPTLIPQSEMTATATSEHTAAGNEGYASYAIDGNENSIWHTDWAGVTFPQSITLNLGGEHTINKFTYLPRQSGDNGKIEQYELQVSTDGETFTKVAEGNWNIDKSLKTINFDEVKATHIRLVATDAVGNFVSAAELNVYKVIDETPNPEVGGKVTITAPTEVNVNDKVNVELGINEIKNVSPYATDFTVTYDPEVFEYNEVTSKVDGVLVTGKKVEDGKIRILASALGGDGLPQGTNFINLDLKAKNISENSAITVDIAQVGDENGNVHEIEKASTTVVVKENAIPDPGVKPNKVTDLKGSEITSNSIKLTWTAPSNTKVAEYIIYKDSIEIARVNGTECLVDGLKANTLYGFKVVAVGANGEISRPFAVNLRTVK